MSCTTADTRFLLKKASAPIGNLIEYIAEVNLVVVSGSCLVLVNLHGHLCHL